MESHLAAPQDDEAGDALVGLGDEHRARRQGEIEIVGRDRETFGFELLRWIERETIQPLDRGDLFLIGHAPEVADLLDVEPPRRSARTGTRFDERVREDAIALSRKGAQQRLAIALLNDDARRAGQRFTFCERLRARPIGRFGDQRHIARRLAGFQRLLDSLKEFLHAVGYRRLRPYVDTAGDKRQREQQRKQKPSHRAARLRESLT